MFYGTSCANSLKETRSFLKVANLTSNVFARSYAKKVKESKSEAAKKARPEKTLVTLTEIELNQVISFDKIKSQMEMTLEHLKKDYVEQLAVHTSLGLLGNLSVETPDGKFPVIQLGQVVQKSAQLMLINLSMTPQHILPVKQAIINAGLNPQQDGTSLFVPIPKVTREHRETLAKSAKVFCEKTKEKLRNIQNNHARELKKAKDEHSADLIFNLHETLLGTTREYMDQAEVIFVNKQKELLGH